jgi:hypothetical protein
VGKTAPLKTILCKLRARGCGTQLELNFASFGWCNVPAMELQGLHKDAALKPAALGFDLADLASQPRIESSAAKAVRHFEQPFVAAMDSLRSP